MMIIIILPTGVKANSDKTTPSSLCCACADAPDQASGDVNECWVYVDASDCDRQTEAFLGTGDHDGRRHADASARVKWPDDGASGNVVRRTKALKRKLS